MFEHLRGSRNGSHDAKASRENRVNQSGSVALSTEAMRGPPWQLTIWRFVPDFANYEPGVVGFETCRARQ